MTNDAIRVLPHDLNAEAAVLGAMLIDDSCIDLVFSQLTEEDFFKSANKVVFRAIHVLRQRDSVDIISLIRYLEDSQEIEKVGGRKYISALSDVVLSATNIETHIRIIRSLSIRRHIILTSSQAIEAAYTSDNISDCVSLLTSIPDKISLSKKKDEPESLADISFNCAKEIENSILHGINTKKAFLLTGFVNLDDHFAMPRGEITVIAARTSQGKSSICHQIAWNVAKDGYSTLYFSNETNKMQTLGYYLSQQKGINAKSLSDTDQKKALEVYVETEYSMRSGPGSKIFICTAAKTSETIINESRRHNSKHSIDLIVVDLLQKVGNLKSDHRHSDISFFVTELDRLAKELDCAIILVSQLKRDNEGSPPKLSEIKDSGSPGEGASNVLLLWRPEKEGIKTIKSVSGSGEISTENLAMLWTAKNRYGDTRRVNLRWCGQTRSFSDY